MCIEIKLKDEEHDNKILFQLLYFEASMSLFDGFARKHCLMCLLLLLPWGTCALKKEMGVMCRECWLGRYDDLSEQAFYMVGGIEEVVQKAEKMAKGMA